MTNIAIENGHRNSDIVDFPLKNGGSFHSYVNVYQRVRGVPNLQEDASNFVMREESRINTFQREKRTSTFRGIPI
jgi:hypothetical protein